MIEKHQLAVVRRRERPGATGCVGRDADTGRARIREIAANGTPAGPMNVSGTTGLGSGAFPRMVRSGEDIVIAWTDASKPAQVRTAVVK